MTRPEGDLPPDLEYTDDDARRYFTDPPFYHKVNWLARYLTHVYGTEKNEAIAFGVQAIKGLEALERQTSDQEPVNQS